jgi:hypothetical protein
LGWGYGKDYDEGYRRIPKQDKARRDKTRQDSGTTRLKKIIIRQDKDKRKGKRQRQRQRQTKDNNDKH